MELMKWEDKFSVNIPELDAQHKHPFYLLNRLHEALLYKRGSDVMTDTIEEMVEYTKGHFRAEEDLMRRRRFPGLDAHAQEHDKLRKKVLEFQRQFADGKVALISELIDFLREWFIKHVTETDSQYGSFYAAHPA